jgi:hypothetical protein
LTATAHQAEYTPLYAEAEALIRHVERQGAALGKIRYGKITRGDLHGGRQAAGRYTWSIVCTLALRASWETRRAYFSPTEAGRPASSIRGTRRALERLSSRGRVTRQGRYTWELAPGGRPVNGALLSWSARNPGADLAARGVCLLAWHRGAWGALGLREIRAALGIQTEAARALAGALRALAARYTRDQIRAVVFYSRIAFRRNDGRELAPFERRGARPKRRPGRPRAWQGRQGQAIGAGLVVWGGIEGGRQGGATAARRAAGPAAWAPGGQQGRQSSDPKVSVSEYGLAFKSKKNEPVFRPGGGPGRRGEPAALAELLGGVLRAATSSTAHPGKAKTWEGDQGEYLAKLRRHYAAKRSAKSADIPAGAVIWAPCLADCKAADRRFEQLGPAAQFEVVIAMMQERKRAGQVRPESTGGPGKSADPGGPAISSYQHFEGGGGLAFPKRKRQK